MAEAAGLRELQMQFAAHLRDPAANPAPAGIEDRRLQIYRDLFYNNVQDFLANAFPVLRRILGDDAWHARVRHFYANHRAVSAQLYALAEEFADHLAAEAGARVDDPPFLAELAHYEWVEMALLVDEDEIDAVEADPDGDLMLGLPALSPLVWTLAYQWPVHKISPDFQPQQAPAQLTYLLVYRDRADKVRFMEANAVTARLMELIESEPDTGNALMHRIAVEMQHPHPRSVVDGGAALLADLRARDIVLGTRRLA